MTKQGDGKGHVMWTDYERDAVVLCEQRKDGGLGIGDSGNRQLFPGIECSIEVREEGFGENGQGGIDICDKILIGLLSIYSNFFFFS